MSTPSRLRARLVRVLDEEGSTRGFGLLRIATVIVVTQRLTYSWAPHQLDLSPMETLMSVIFWMSAFSSFVGWRTQASVFVFASAYSIIHFYYGKVLGHGSLGNPAQPVQVLWLLVFMPCGRSFSLDRWFALRRARREGTVPPEERGPLFMRWGLVLHLVSLYLWAVYDKSDPEWFTGARLERIWMSHYGSSDDFLNYGGALHGLSLVAAWASCAVELVLVIGLWFPRAYRFVIPLALAMHLAFWLILGVGPFSSMMMSVYLGVADPRGIHDFIDTMVGAKPRADGASASPSRGTGP